MEGKNENKCPLCGKDTHEGEMFCHDCQETVRHEYPEEFFQTEENDPISETENTEEIIEDDSPITEEPKKKKSNKFIAFFLVALVVCVIAGSIGSNITKKEKQSKEVEAAFWDKCIEENTTLSYSKYLVHYPEGIFKQEAQNKILELKRTEDSTWISISETNNTDKLYLYLTDYPSTPHKNTIRQRIDSLSWIILSKENTADSYQAYLENIKLDNYDGKYKEEAQKRYDYLSSLTIVEGEELEIIKKEIKQVFKLLSEQKYTELQKSMPDTLTDFYGKKGKKVSQITDSLKTDKKRKQLKSIIYTPDTKSITVIRDMDSIYYTGFPLGKEFTFTSRRKKKESTKSTIYIEMNNKKQIQAVYKEKKKF